MCITFQVILNLMNYKMLIYERIDVSEGIDFDKTDKSKECIIDLSKKKTLILKSFSVMVVMIFQ